MNKTKLFDLAKCFLTNWDNFCPYEQSLRKDSYPIDRISANLARGEEVSQDSVLG